ANVVRRAKEWGYSDVQIATVWKMTPQDVRAFRKQMRIEPVYKLVDTCAAEFEAATPYYYSTYESPIRRLSASTPGKPGAISEITDDEIRVSNKKKVII